ncbi:Methyltrn RNA 3 domain containing protein [Trichuris trichiura]|uniref:Methyltrn RNA 3 domain containing protein n=1 Tax=Trichuris trichiura TaxID=36087 RepID=A0A077ZBY9_TRITR|nr:Methyltrn RNA 3 domain containing protein [Trichuris trichiura]
MNSVEEKEPSGSFTEEEKAARKYHTLVFVLAVVESLIVGKKKLLAKKRRHPLRRRSTLSVALPGSILENAQSAELRSYLAGQIARTLTIFCVDEVVVYDEVAQLTSSDCDMIERGVFGGESGNAIMVKILRFLECPQYLRKHLFPLSPDLRWAGLLNPLNSSHHLTKDELSIPFREAVVLEKPSKPGHGSWCYAGLKREVEIDKSLVPGTRVTLEVVDKGGDHKWRKAKVVSPLKPAKTIGRYWGYNVRLAKSLNAALSECPYKSGYDLLIGTSDKGRNVDEVTVPSFKHALIVFGGLKGIEYCVENDESIGTNDVASLFNLYINTCPNQGCRSIRTEEAMLITLSALQPKLQSAVRSS